MLLFYKAQQHMEIGVDLGTAPTEARVQVFSVNVQNVSYYIAECYGQPMEGRLASRRNPLRIPERFIPSSAAREYGAIVHWASFSKPARTRPQHFALQVSPSIMLGSNNVTISGQILPQTANENVTLQAKINSNSWTTIATVQTQADGRFQYIWASPTDGSVPIQASWLGNRQYNGATSTQTNVIVLPLFMVALIAALVFAVVVFVLVVIKTRRRKQKPTQITTQPVETAPSPSTPLNS